MNHAAFKELTHVIRYMLDKNHGLKLYSTRNASKPWEIVCFIHGDHVGSPVSKRSLSGLILYVLDVPVSWQSKDQSV